MAYAVEVLPRDFAFRFTMDLFCVRVGCYVHDCDDWHLSGECQGGEEEDSKEEDCV